MASNTASHRNWKISCFLSPITFLTPTSRPSCQSPYGQCCKVDTGDQQYNRSDTQNDPYIFRINIFNGGSAKLWVSVYIRIGGCNPYVEYVLVVSHFSHPIYPGLLLPWDNIFSEINKEFCISGVPLPCLNCTNVSVMTVASYPHCPFLYSDVSKNFKLPIGS